MWVTCPISVHPVHAGVPDGLAGFRGPAFCPAAAGPEYLEKLFSYIIDTTGNMTLLPTSNTSFNVTAVNIEQNSTRTPVNYLSPPGVLRQQELSSNNVNLLLNEQAMSLQICNLVQGDVSGVYKTTNMDLRRYGTMDMFVHAEAVTSRVFNDNDLSAMSYVSAATLSPTIMKSGAA
jgi:hypothetical protein